MHTKLQEIFKNSQIMKVVMLLELMMTVLFLVQKKNISTNKYNVNNDTSASLSILIKSESKRSGIITKKRHLSSVSVHNNKSVISESLKNCPDSITDTGICLFIHITN
jgi:competence protein ComGC